MVIYLSIYFGMTIYIYMICMIWGIDWYQENPAKLRNMSCWQFAGKLLASLQGWSYPSEICLFFLARALDAWPFLNNDHMMSTVLLTGFFPASFSWYLPNQVLRNPGDIVDSTVKGSLEASSNWLRPSCSFWTWAFLPFHSPCRLSMCPVFYVAQWFFLPEKEAEFYPPRDAVLLHDIHCRLLPTY